MNMMGVLSMIYLQYCLDVELLRLPQNREGVSHDLYTLYTFTYTDLMTWYDAT